MKKTRLLMLALSLVLIWGIVGLSVSADSGIAKQAFVWLTAKKLTVWYGGSQFYSDVDIQANLDVSGDLTADLTGDVSGATGVFTTSVTSPSFVGNVSGATGTFTTSVTSPSFVGDLTGDASGATGVFTTSVTSPSFVGDLTGNASGATGVFTTSVTSPSFVGDLAGDASGATGTFTTSVTSPSFVGDLTGNVSGATGVFTTSVTTPMLSGAVLVDGSADAAQLTVQGNATQTSDLLVLEKSDGTDRFNVTNDGHVVVTVTEADAATTDYDEWVHIQGYAMGTDTKARNYPLVIEMTRPAGQEITSGDHDEAGLKIRVDTEAVTTTAGTVLRAIDAEAKADNPGGTVTSLYGASVTAKSDTSAGSVGTMVGLTSNSMANAEVTAFMASADLRLMRQSANEPTEEYVVYVRNDSTTGSGADAGIYVTSNYTPSATTDSMDYGLDMGTAAINTADIRLQNDETIGNTTDGTVDVTADNVDVSGDLVVSLFGRFEAQTPIEVTAGGSFTPTGTYQPITATVSLGLSDITPTTAGDLLILVNETDVTITITNTGTTMLGGENAVLTQYGSLTLICDGTNWLQLCKSDN